MKSWKIFPPLIVLLIGLFFGVAYLVQKNVGDLRPALLPALKQQEGASPQPASVNPSENSENDSETGSPTSLQPHPFLNVPDGFTISTFATDTPGARDLEFSPAGVLLVSLRTSGKVVALPDANHDGIADKVVEVIKGLKNPHGIVFYNNKLFIAEERQVARYSWDEGALKATFEKKLVDLPSGGSGHMTRSLVFDQKGNLYISVGSDCNVCIEKEPWQASVIITDEEGNNPRIFARGLRNAVFLTYNESLGQVWASDMGRDLLGDDTPPDEINILKQEGSDFGWPYCYDNKIYDQSFGKESAAYCEKTLSPTFKIPAHSAPLGLTFVKSTQFPADWQGDLLVSYHGSWNRSVPTGYKVVRLHVDKETVMKQEDFITGFLQNNQATGRPVDVIFDQNGNLFVSDDKAGAIYLVTFSR
jgi:glucose/arabinose dehydrogenase